MNLDENSAQGMYFRTGASCRRWDTEEICLIDSRFLSPFSLSFFFFFCCLTSAHFTSASEWSSEWNVKPCSLQAKKKKKNPILFILHFKHSSQAWLSKNQVRDVLAWRAWSIPNFQQTVFQSTLVNASFRAWKAFFPISVKLKTQAVLGLNYKTQTFIASSQITT